MDALPLAGPWRRPRNTSAHEKGGIHDDETAQALGFAGGTVAGSIHLEQFVPFLVEQLGERWYEDGSLSLYFREATQDGEPVCCRGSAPREEDGRLRMDIGLENEAGTIVMDGTAALGGPDPASALARRLAEVRPAQALRVLADVVPERWSAPREVELDPAEIDRQLRVITEPLPMHGRPGDGPGRVAPLSVLVHLLRAVEPDIAPTRGPFVGLFGAIELAFHQGQPVTGPPYRLRGRVRALSESPKTEILWMESRLEDADTGAPCVTMLKMDRVMKASSPLWADG